LAKKIKISACYIVKNEARELKISIESLKKFVDEIVVVDTGSTDDTVKVAKKFGAKIFYCEWNDDFSAPRNLALKKCSGDWIIFLDADEFFTPETAKNIPAVIERVEQFKQNAILVQRVNIDTDDGNKIQSTDFSVRIMKNRNDLHYVGKIHEELRLGEKILSEVVTCPPDILKIYHTGYKTSINKLKAERNLKLLLAELAETQEPQRIYYYIAECYGGLGDFANAEKFSVLDIESNSFRKSDSYNLLLSILAKDKLRQDDRKKIAEMAVRDFPKLPEFSAELAECFAVKGDFKKAVETMTEALEKFKHCEGEPTQFSESAKDFAERRIKIWNKFMEENNEKN